MDWVEVFINQVLQDVPRGRYEKRVRNELRDHMETEYRILTEAGRTPQEAQEEILHTIGEPEQLREEYEEAWKRTGRTDMAVFRTKIVAFGCILMGILYIGTFYFMISSVITGFYDGIDFWTPRTFPPMPPEEVFAVSA